MTTKRTKPAASAARSAAPQPAPTPRTAPDLLKVATYNIHKGVLREYFGLQRLATIHELRTRLHQLDADLVFLQEVCGRHDRHARRFKQWPTERQDQYLARSPQLNKTFESAYGPNANYLHGNHGNALLSRYTILKQDHRDVSDNVLEKRGVLHCVVKVGALPVHCFVVHLSLFARSRARQAAAMIDWINKAVPINEPLLIAGDFNDWRDQLTPLFVDGLSVSEVFGEAKPMFGGAQRAARFVAGRLAEAGLPLDPAKVTMPTLARPARTFPTLIPWLKMDRIYQRGFLVHSAQVLGGPAWAKLSDHAPLIATLQLDTRRGRRAA